MDHKQAEYVTFGLSNSKETEGKRGLLQKLASYFKAAKQPSWNSRTTEIRDDSLTWAAVEPSISSSEGSLSKRIGSDAADGSPGCTSSHPSGTVTPTMAVTNSGPMRLQSYSNASLKQMSDRRYWMLDESCRYCFECGCRFTTIRRKHHCRVCGRIFCHQCSDKVVDGHLIGMSGLQRSCYYCAYTLLAVQNRAVGNDSSVTLPAKIVRSSSTYTYTTSSDGIKNVSGGLHMQNTVLPDQQTDTDMDHIEEGDLFSSGMPANSSVTSHCPESPLVITGDDGSLYQKSSTSTITSNTSLGRPLRTSRDEQHSLDWMIPAVRLEAAGGTCTNTTAINFGKHSARDPRGLNRYPGLMQTSGVTTVADGQLQSQIHISDYSNTGVYDFSDSKVIDLWLTMVSGPLERGVEAISCNSQSADEKDAVVSSETSKISGNQSGLTPWNQGDLQVIYAMDSDQNTVCYYAFGFNLVYWLVSNVPELGRSREKARVICQRFLDLSLMTELNNDACGKDFRDDFTPYELKKAARSVDETPRKAAARPSWPYSWFTRSLPQSPTQRTRDSESLLKMCDLSSDTMSLLVEEPTDGNYRKSSSTTLHMSDDTASTTVKDAPTASHLLLSQSSSLIDRMTSGGGTSADLAEKAKNLVVEQTGNLFQPTNLVYQDVHHTIKDAYSDHIDRLIIQDLRDNCLDVSTWKSCLISLAHSVCSLISFDLRIGGLKRQAGNETGGCDELSAPSRKYPPSRYAQMDPRHYVHVKKLVDEPALRSELFAGLVFTKSATQRHMASKLQDPRILLLASSITYQRTPTKLTRLESQIMQEEQYLSNCVSKLLLLHPRVIFVGGIVSHVAQTLLLKAGVTLFCNVKQTVLRKLSDITGADILSSVDRLVVGDIDSKSSPTGQATTQALPSS